MRRYEIQITDQDGKAKIVNGPNGIQVFNGTFTSTDPFGNPIPGALNIELDAPISVYNSPIGGAYLRIYGIGLPLLRQAADFNPSVDGSKYCNIKISAGMAKGLPLSTPSQYGTILQARIQQAFGNWQGISQTLDFVMLQPVGSTENPYNFSMTCQNNAFLGDAIRATLAKVFPGATVNINISNRLIAPETISCVYSSLGQFSTFINEKSRDIFNDKSYPGVQVSFTNNTINVYDYTVPSQDKPIQVNFNDLVGQPTWIAPGTLTFKATMRYDIRVGSQVIMPSKEVASRGLALTTPESQSQYKNSVDFSGVFTVQTVRHLGNFRQPDGNSWVTIYQIYKPVL